MSPTHFRQMLLDKARVSRLEGWRDSYGLDAEDERELASLLRRIEWLKRQLGFAGATQETTAGAAE